MGLGTDAGASRSCHRTFSGSSHEPAAGPGDRRWRPGPRALPALPPSSVCTRPPSVRRGRWLPAAAGQHSSPMASSRSETLPPQARSRPRGHPGQSGAWSCPWGRPGQSGFRSCPRGRPGQPGSHVLITSNSAASDQGPDPLRGLGPSPVPRGPLGTPLRNRARLGEETQRGCSVPRALFENSSDKQHKSYQNLKLR